MRSRAGAVGVGLALVLLVLIWAVTHRLGPFGGQATDTPPTRPPATALATAPAPRSSAPSATDTETGLRLVEVGSLPEQAQRTVARIERGGPYPYAKDGAVFSNRERVLPGEPAGFYHEYTVVTPGSDDRGARRIVTGDHDRQFFYTGDHYVSFVRIRR